MTEANAVAADTNLIRHPTPRRYLTALEELRGRRVAILPMVDRELRGQLALQAKAYIRGVCDKDGKSAEETRIAARAATGAALEWWNDERTRNRTAYMHVPDLGEPHYLGVAADLPDEAFLDDNRNDQLIYAQAWAHGIDVLASRNRRTILREKLERHFAELDYPIPPVVVRNLYEHTLAIAGNERRTDSDVALEAVLGAVIPDHWTPDKSADVMGSCVRFIRNLTVTPEQRALDVGDYALVRILSSLLNRIDGKEFAQRCNEIHARRPGVARGKRSAEA